MRFSDYEDFIQFVPIDQVKDDMSWANHSTRLIESVCEFAILERAANFTSSDVGVTSSLPSWPIALRDAIGCPVGCGRGYCDEGRCLCDDGLTGEVCNIVIGLDFVFFILLKNRY